MTPKYEGDYIVSGGEKFVPVGLQNPQICDPGWGCMCLSLCGCYCVCNPEVDGVPLIVVSDFIPDHPDERTGFQPDHVDERKV